jgi:hypothetical protein
VAERVLHGGNECVLDSVRTVTVTRASIADVDWIVSTLTERRRGLLRFAPAFWHPAPKAAEHHRGFIEHLLAEGGATAYRTDHSVLIAVPRGHGWLVDDAHAPRDSWSGGDGAALWNAFATDCGGAEVRFVCPTYEQERTEFAAGAGLRIAESWWLRELGHEGGAVGVEVSLPGADAITVGAPPVYAPPGPILFLPDPIDAKTAIPAALDRARDLGCAAIVANQASGRVELARDLAEAGFRRHCDYFNGSIRAT